MEKEAETRALCPFEVRILLFPLAQRQTTVLSRKRKGPVHDSKPASTCGWTAAELQRPRSCDRLREHLCPSEVLSAGSETHKKAPTLEWKTKLKLGWRTSFLTFRITIHFPEGTPKFLSSRIARRVC